MQTEKKIKKILINILINIEIIKIVPKLYHEIEVIYIVNDWRGLVLREKWRLNRVFIN